jgi:16S rRNA (cytosine967-C5)-methyltransferase
MKSSPKEAGAKKSARMAQAGLPARRAAVELLVAVLEKKQSLDEVLGRSLATGWLLNLPQRDRALMRAIVATALRRRGQIDHVLANFLERGLPENSGTLYAILLSAAAQLIFLKIPAHAVIDLAVTLAQYDSRAKRYDKLANAVLRRVAKEGAEIADRLDAPRVNTPDWLWQRWVTNWGEERTRAIASLNMVEPSLDLTVKSDPARWAERLEGRVLPTGSVRLLPKGRIEHLDGYEEGAWWVQDAAASLPVRLLGDVAGLQVADLCAAPGGKTAQLVQAGASVIAVDQSETRLRTVRANLKRLGQEATVLAADVTTWKPEERFDAVLLDAPCTGTGTVRRHPDIPYLKSAADIVALAGLQTRLLDNAASLLKPGGRLVYATCSLEPEEGEAQIAAFLVRHPDFALDPVSPDEVFDHGEWVENTVSLRTFPDALRLETPEWSGMDGFFAARMVRRK